MNPAVLLAEARAAYHALMTGTSVVEVRDSTGESVRYSVANASRLKIYIDELAASVAGTTRTITKPLRPHW